MTIHTEDLERYGDLGHLKCSCKDCKRLNDAVNFSKWILRMNNNPNNKLAKDCVRFLGKINRIFKNSIKTGECFTTWVYKKQ